MEKKARIIAFYLPQFHPIPENDLWWGKGFTEWTNVGKARPLFKGHYQPRVPADLGYYDLRMPSVRKAQAQLAKDAGIEGFCYWHYWFGDGKQLLQTPFQEVLNTGEPDFPFCLGWANETWTNKSWEEGTRRMKLSILVEQKYSNEDYIRHFYYVLPAFKDKRYINVDGCPLFLVFKPLSIPNAKYFIELWNRLAVENGLKGIHFVGIQQNIDLEKDLEHFVPNINNSANLYKHILGLGFNAVNSRGYWRAEFLVRNKFEMGMRMLLKKFGYKTVVRCNQCEINKVLYVQEDRWENVYPTLLPQWDRSARSGRNAHVYVGSTPKVFKAQLQEAISLVEKKKREHRLLFLQSWNEWAEGNYVEPDLKYGHGFLDVIRDCILK